MRDEVTPSVDPASVPPAVPHSIELLAPGTRIGDRYEIRRVVGSGGQAVVYLASDRDLKRDVALKVLRPDRSSPALEKRFRREAAIARDAAHPNLVRIFDIESSGAAIYLSMEHIDGESLRTRIERGPMTISEVVALTRQILDGLDALHSRGIVHRDVKPGNILIDAAGVAKVADFGLARNFAIDESKATDTGAVLGTVDYISPEQALGKDVDVRSDLYSVGVVLFEMLTGHMPFSAETELGLLLQRVKSRAPSVRTFRPDCPRWLAQIVARLVEPEPKDRYASAKEVLADISRRHARFKLRRRGLAVAGATTAAILAALLIWTWAAAGRRFSHFVVSPGGVTAVDRQSHALWRLAGSFDESLLARQYAMVRLAEGRFLALVPRRTARLGSGKRQQLLLIEPETGRTVRTIDLPDARDNFLDSAPLFVPEGVHAVDLDHDGYDEIVAVFIHGWHWASYTVLFEPRIGRGRVVFSGSGHHRLAGVADVNGDGRDDLLLAGINNVLGWYNAIAAVGIQPPVDTAPGNSIVAAFTPDSWYSSPNSLIWYALLPRGKSTTYPVVRLEGGLLTYQAWNGRTVRLGIDGLLSSGTPQRARVTARQSAYDHLVEAKRLLAAGSRASAESEIRAGVAAAEASGEPILAEAMKRQYGRLLIACGKVSEAEELLSRLATGSENTSEIEFDAAQALHLRGDLRRAAAHYLAGMTRGARPDEGRSKQDFIEGAVLALTEAGLYEDAIAAADRFAAEFPSSRSSGAFFREYARWRSGKVPREDAVEVLWNATDFTRSCSLEMKLAAGEDPQSILDQLDAAAESRSEMRGALLSLRAEVYWKLGRRSESADLAGRAYDLARVERLHSTWARAQYPLVRERFQRLTGAKASD